VTSPFDVIALGETMLSLVATDGPLASATRFHVTHGGAETNTLVGLSRLGLRTAWVSRLGTDVVGDRIHGALADEGIDLRWTRRDEHRPTGVMIRDTHGCVEYRRAGSAASALSVGDLQEVPIETARAVVVTGITGLLGADPQHAALAVLERATGLRAVDPHLRPGLWGSDHGRELVLPLIANCDLALGGEHELRHLVGEDDVTVRGEALARRILALGPAEVVLKRGPDGAGALDREGRWHEHSPAPVPDVDPVGAGDAFNAGYLAARLSGAEVSDALVRGAYCGAAVAGVIGDTEGFPRPGEHP
jgi:2-dehydro-3-deoxygluconokinase